MKLRGGKEKKQHSLLRLFYGTVPADRPLSSARGTKGKKTRNFTSGQDQEKEKDTQELWKEH